MGAPRITTLLSIHTRTDRDQTLEDKIASVQARRNVPIPSQTGSG
jgi:uncharacterized protein YqgV (UPF0045/DUF77 family)